MPDSGFLALFLVGLLGGTHCVGMCGGIVSAMSMGGGAGWGMHLAYNSGRILSYAAAGAIAGALGAASMGLEGQVPIAYITTTIAGIMMAQKIHPLIKSLMSVSFLQFYFYFMPAISGGFR